MKHVFRHVPGRGDRLIYSHPDKAHCEAHIATLLPDVQVQCYIEDDDDYYAAQTAELAAHSHPGAR